MLELTCRGRPTLLKISRFRTSICEDRTKMEQCSSSCSLSYQSTKFLRVLLSLSLIGTIIISSQFSTVRAVPLASRSTNGDITVGSNSTRRSVVDNSTASTEVQASSHHHHHHRQSSYVVRATLRQQQQHLQETQRKGAANVRRLASQFGCLANATMCLTMPGLTVASKASTCCSNGLCTDTQFDAFNCNACGNVCTLGTSCCSGVCVATGSNSKNCGGCGKTCMKPGVCILGFCGY